jgi:hypothetical protein
MNKFRSNQADYIDKTRSRFQRKVDIVSKDDDPNIDMNNVDFQTHSVFNFLFSSFIFIFFGLT